VAASATAILSDINLSTFASVIPFRDRENPTHIPQNAGLPTHF
jgi:hypothetical protein